MSNSHNENTLKLLSNQGQGRTFVILFDDLVYQTWANSIGELLQQHAKVLIFCCSTVTANNWQVLGLELKQQLDALAVRQTSLVGLGAASALVQYLGLSEVKLVRSLVLVDAACRPHPSWRDRLIDRIETSLPLGLPFRSSTEGFDSKPFLQRLRCPVLLVLTGLAVPFVRQQAVEMAGTLPTAWVVELPQTAPETELARLIEEFQDVPVKCPQKASVQLSKKTA